MAYQLGDKPALRMDAVAAGEQSLDIGPGDGLFGLGKGRNKNKSFKSCNGFYKDGQCYRNRKAYREYKKHQKGKKH